MANLKNSDRLVINELLDTGIFASHAQRPSADRQRAVDELKLPSTKRRLNSYLKGLIGTAPRNYQQNLLLMLGSQRMDTFSVHVLVATMKAVINEPSLQNGGDDRVIEVSRIVRQVASVVREADEREIVREINTLFVDRLGLFVPDAAPGNSQTEGFINDFWDVNPSFTQVARCLVDEIKTQNNAPDGLELLQQVNRALLTHAYLSPESTPHTWELLQAYREEIAAQWDELGRYRLECGQEYALLLDTRRHPSESRPYIVAMAVAHSLGVGIPEKDLTARIRQLTRQLFGDNPVQPSTVKDALFESHLAQRKDDYVIPTPIVRRYKVTVEDDND